MATNQELARIVNKIRGGDSSAFSDLYDATYKSVFYHTQTIRIQYTTAQDIAVRPCIWVDLDSDIFKYG